MLFNILLLIVCSIIMPISIRIILPCKVEKTRGILCTFLCSLCVAISSLVFKNELSVISIFVTMGCCLKVVYKCTWRELIVMPVLYGVVCLLNMLVNVMAYKIIGFSQEIVESAVFSFVGASVALLLMMPISYAIKFCVEYFAKSENTKYKRARRIFIVADIILFVLVVWINNWAARINNYGENIETANLIIYVTYTLLMTVIVLVVFKVTKEQEAMDREKEQYRNLAEYASQIETMYTNLRSFKHDYINIIATLSGYIEEADYVGLEKYFNENIVPTSKKMNRDNYRLNQLKNIKDLALKGIISSKLILANEIGAMVYIDIMEPIESFGVNAVDLGRVLGIFLDNSIEAIMEIEDKQVKFNIAKDGDNVCITLMNTFKGDKVPISKIYQKGFSSKGDNRGFGLYNVKQILQKYENVSRSTRVEDGFFVQQLEISVD